MSKKKIRAKTASKGSRRNVVNCVAAVRRARPAVLKALYKLKAWKAGKNPWITISGVKTRANDLYGSHKKGSY